MSRRSRASRPAGISSCSASWLGAPRLGSEIPNRLGQCKTPADLFKEQTRFWQAAGADYAESSQTAGGRRGARAPSMPKLNGTQPRDYITFPGPQEAAPAAPKRGERKAA